MTRDAAPRIGGHKPALVESRFFPALKGESGKMSASDPSRYVLHFPNPASLFAETRLTLSFLYTSAIYVTDTPKQIKDKINKYAFSGGRETLEEHREKGGDLDVDIPWKWLNFFMEDDQALASIGSAFASGTMSSGEIKKELIDCLSPMIAAHQSARSLVSEAIVDQFFSTAPRDFQSMFGALEGPPPTPTEGAEVSFQGSETRVAFGAPTGEETSDQNKSDEEIKVDADAPLSKNALKKIQKEREILEKKLAKAAEKAAAKAAGGGGRECAHECATVQTNSITVTVHLIHLIRTGNRGLLSQPHRRP